MADGESVTVPAGSRKRPRRIGAMLRSQMRNIAPFLTLICLFGFFAVASPSFATLDNLGNILTQISVTGIIAVGLTFVILCAEIDLSVASIANVTGIAVAYFTAQESYVNIANMPMPGWVAIVLALAKWLSYPPRLLVLCEPTRGMDVGAKNDVIHIIRDLRARGLAVIVLSTEPETVLSLADRVIVLKRGAVVREFSNEQISKDRLLEAA